MLNYSVYLCEISVENGIDKIEWRFVESFKVIGRSEV